MPDTSLLDIVTTHVRSGRGGAKKAQPLSLEIIRELTPADLDLIQNPPPKGVTTSAISRLRYSHHQLARLLASGTKPGEASLITGYSPSRISILQNDPAFKELLAYYSAQANDQYLDVHSRLATLGTNTIEELSERLEDSPESFSHRELLELAELTLDRSVAPPKGGKGFGPSNGPGPAPVINIQFVAPQPLPAPSLAPQIEGATSPEARPEAPATFIDIDPEAPG